MRVDQRTGNLVALARQSLEPAHADIVEGLNLEHHTDDPSRYSAVTTLKVRHKINQGLNTLSGHGIVDRCAHSTD